jgi:hypothetical protein
MQLLSLLVPVYIISLFFQSGIEVRERMSFAKASFIFQCVRKNEWLWQLGLDVLNMRIIEHRLAAFSATDDTAGRTLKECRKDNF